MKVTLVAAPLMARSGVYRSALDLVEAARREGHEWNAVLGVRPEAAGTPSDVPRVLEVAMPEHGRHLFGAINRLLDRGDVSSSDVVISLIPQTDMIVSRRRDLRGARRVAWVRGLPWPAATEQNAPRRLVLEHLERRALRRFDDVWSTTPLLESQLGRSGRGRTVAAGVPLLERASRADRSTGPIVFAGRLSPEKGAEVFVRIAARTGIISRIHGTGPLEAELRRASPTNLEWGGWRTPAEIWSDASVCVAPSLRDAFGRTPVEAASAGVPVVMSDQVGAADLLYTDPTLRERFVLPLGDDQRWDSAVSDLCNDPHLYHATSEHVAWNARSLTIGASLRGAIDGLVPNHTRPEHRATAARNT